MGILYAIRYAKSALGRLYFHFFPHLVNGFLLVNVFYRMFMTLFLRCFNFTFLGLKGIVTPKRGVN